MNSFKRKKFCTYKKFILVKLKPDKHTRANIDMIVLFDHMKMWHYYLSGQLEAV
jgi:hypothetical protein